MTTTLTPLDLDPDHMNYLRQRETVACDIETTGLDWRSERIATVQVAAGGEVIIVQLVKGQERPPALVQLMSDETVTKVFHHAVFDLRFLAYHWNVTPANIACTKVAAKIAFPGETKDRYSLKPLLARLLNVTIDKSQQRSDWAQSDLTPAQLAYAAADVQYLPTLLQRLTEEVAKADRTPILQRSFAFLPTRVQLDLLGAGDVFSY